MIVKELSLSVDRNAKSIKCKCGGFAEEVSCSQEEIQKYGCGRSYSCCSRAFVCCLCKIRWVGTAEAPEME